MADFSFDIVSKFDPQEVRNAVEQASREIGTRYDFRGSVSEIELEENALQIHSDDDFKLKAVVDVLQSKLVRRGVDLKSLDYGKVEPASGGTVRQTIRLRQGIDKDLGKKIVKIIKDSKHKVQAQIQEDQVRVSSKSKDELQAVMQLLRGQELNIPLQFENYR